ncbi:chemotaxis protein CheB [Marinifilum sp.]|uniref:chemotaxis protein CheB n=1 Tax=Marinifilum sp. TaxID=2033137 RepID=UPI003BA85E43
MDKVLVIGTSYGGLEALKIIIPSFPKDFILPVLVVLHIGDHNNDSFIDFLNNISKLNVKEAEEKEVITAGNVYFAPPNYHMLIDNDASISFSADTKVHHSRPSIDVLFESAAWSFNSGVIGVILSGLNQDGTYGLKTIKKYGGITMVENPENAIASIMPMSALKQTKVDYVLELDQIAAKIIELSAKM